MFQAQNRETIGNT